MTDVRRRVQALRVLTFGVGLAMLTGCPTSASPDAPLADAGTDAGGPPGDFRISLSVSPFTETLLGATLGFEDGVSVALTREALTEQLVRHGATEVYARLSTERLEVSRGGAHAMESVLARARIASDLDLPLNVELGLFGSYGDVSCQHPPSFLEYPAIVLPGAWETLTVDQMVVAIRAFAAAVATEILATGVTVNVWDLGNEVDLGTAGVAVAPLLDNACNIESGTTDWYRAPDAVDAAIGTESVGSLLAMSEASRVAWLELHVWPHVARLLDAAREGIASVDPGARFSTHVSGVSATPVAALAFYRAMDTHGLVLDELGFSFYPSSPGPASDRLGTMRTMVEMLRADQGLPVFMAELAYPAEPFERGSFSDWDVPSEGYPLTNEGQAAFLRDVASWGASGPLSGMRYWAPEVGAGDWYAFGLYEPASAMTLRPRPGLDAIRAGASAPDPDAI